MTNLEQIEVEIKLIDDRIEQIEEALVRLNRRIAEKEAGHRILENTPAAELARMKEEGRI